MQVGAAAQIAQFAAAMACRVDSDSRQIGGDSVLGSPRALITERDPGPVTCVAPTVSARSSARRSAGRPLVVEDGHQHLVVPAPVVQHGLAEAALLEEPRLLVG